MGEDPPDRRHGRGVSVASLEVIGDRGRPGFVPIVIEVLADLDDLVSELVWDPRR